MKKRIIAILLSLCLVLPLVPLTAGAVADLTATIDTGASVTLTDTDGDGYYDIGTADELYAFAALVNGGNGTINGELTDHITVNNNVLDAEGDWSAGRHDSYRAWTPIGTYAKTYGGTFDGRDFTISGLYFRDSTAKYMGLFGYVNLGKIRNVGILDSFFCGETSVGGIAAFIQGGSIDNCYNAGAIDGSAAGGIVGVNRGSVRNCHNAGYIYDGGGIAGVLEGAGSIYNCYNTGTISGYGGIAGRVLSGCAISKCYNTGTIDGDSYCGGIAGCVFGPRTEILSCYNAGNVSGYNFKIGGVVGTAEENATIADCYNVGSVIGNSWAYGDPYYVGGIAGYSKNASVTNCYYRTDCALDSSGYPQNGIGADTVGTAVEDVDGATAAVTDAQLASGEVCYLLDTNVSSSNLHWYQTLGTHTIPQFEGQTVYKIKCVDVTAYSNTSGNLSKHTWVDGPPRACAVCGTTVCDINGGHNWIDGICYFCHIACTHTWTDATCTAPRTCSVCGGTEGDPLTHSWATDGKCDLCGASCPHPTYENNICTQCGKEYTLHGANVDLENTLNMYFYVDKTVLTQGQDYYATVIRTLGDGTTQEVQKELTNYNDDLLRFDFSDLPARAMADAMTVTLHNAADNSQVGKTWNDSIRSYAHRMLEKEDSSDSLRTLLVDMLSYGAAAQTYFEYNTSDPANTGLAESTTVPSYPADSAAAVVSGEYKGSTISLKSNMVLTLYFADDLSGCTAEATYTDHYGKPQTATTSLFQNGEYWGVDISGFAVADGMQDITVTVKNGDTVVAQATDSVIKYLSRMQGKDAIYDAVAKFVTSAYNYFKTT